LLPIKRGERQTLRIAWGGFRAGKNRPSPPVKIEIDGAVALEVEGAFEFLDPHPPSVWIGGSSPAGAGFSGLIYSVRRLADAP
jgi:hypothetical protein